MAAGLFSTASADTGLQKTEIILQPDRAITDTADIQRAVRIIEQRLQSAGLGAASIKPVMPNQIHLQIHDPEIVDRVLQLALGRAHLEFRLVIHGSADPLRLSDLEEAAFTGPIISSVAYEISEFTDTATVTFDILPELQDEFADFTGRNIGRRVAVVLDGVILTAPVMQAPIAGRVQITGLASLEEASRVAALLSSDVVDLGLEVVSRNP